MRSKIAMLFGILVATALAGKVIAVSLPSGERQLGRTIIEPAYDDRDGNLIYLMTPIGAPFPSKPPAQAQSPLYLPVYPNTAAGAVGVMNCMHEGGDNCPDHGPGIADLAQAVMPNVYGSGVWGHDHLVDGPGGSEFNVAWHVIVILFTSPEAATHHLITDEQVDAALARGDAIAIDSGIVFNCQVTAPATYRRATPLAPVH